MPSAIAPVVRPEYIANAMFAEASISLTIIVIVAGSPCPPNSVGTEMPTQPPSTSWR